MAYKITAEVKKGLIKQMGIVKNSFGNTKVDVEVRNFECVRV